MATGATDGWIVEEIATGASDGWIAKEKKGLMERPTACQKLKVF
jgi:hypothetical protein